jgi:[protein-PII] uridylyltransferase
MIIAALIEGDLFPLFPGEDRVGILYEITQALTDHGCDIHFARVSTLGNRIVDVFYVQDAWGEKIEEKNSVDQLKKTLSRLIFPEKNLTLVEEESG